MTNTEIISIVLTIIAVLIAIWQGMLSKSQLEQSKQTKSETEKLLEEIKLRVHKIELTSDETRKDVKDQVARLIDKQDENFKTLLNAPKENSQNELMMTLLPQVIQNPELFNTLVKLGQNK